MTDAALLIASESLIRCSKFDILLQIMLVACPFSSVVLVLFTFPAFCLSC